MCHPERRDRLREAKRSWSRRTPTFRKNSLEKIISGSRSGVDQVTPPQVLAEGRGPSTPHLRSQANAVATLRMTLLQRFGLEPDVFLAGSFLFHIFLDPGFPAFACGGVASGKGEGCDIGVRNHHSLVGSSGKHSYDGLGQGRAALPVEQIPFDRGSVFAGDGHIAAIIKCFFESFAGLFFRRQRRNPAFKFLVLPSRRNLKRIGSHGSRRFRFVGNVPGSLAGHARVSSRVSAAFAICTNGAS